jgi:hypothetical protein
MIEKILKYAEKPGNLGSSWLIIRFLDFIILSVVSCLSLEVQPLEIINP